MTDEQLNGDHEPDEDEDDDVRSADQILEDAMSVQADLKRAAASPTLARFSRALPSDIMPLIIDNLKSLSATEDDVEAILRMLDRSRLVERDAQKLYALIEVARAVAHRFLPTERDAAIVAELSLLKERADVAEKVVIRAEEEDEGDDDEAEIEDAPAIPRADDA